MSELAKLLDTWCALEETTAARKAALTCRASEVVLVPLCRGHVDDDDLMQRLAAWRNSHVRAFPSRFQATAKSTRSWLLNNVLPGDRILFLLQPAAAAPSVATQHTFAHVGIAGYREADRGGCIELENIVRGVPDAHPGAMHAAMLTLIELGERFEIRSQQLSVFDDNQHAIAFYKRLGFAGGKHTPMRRVSSTGDDSVAERPVGDSKPGDEHMLHMLRTSARQEGAT